MDSKFYEVLPIIKDATGQCSLSASFTPSNGIRIGIADENEDTDWVEFDFNEDQAEAIGQALVRWSQRQRAEGEMIRCNRYRDGK